MTPRNCSTCEYWLYSYHSIGEDFGVCESSLVEGHVILTGEDNEEEDCVIHTSSHFGCVHHQPKGGYIVSHLPNDLPGL